MPKIRILWVDENEDTHYAFKSITDRLLKNGMFVISTHWYSTHRVNLPYLYELYSRNSCNVVVLFQPFQNDELEAKIPAIVAEFKKLHALVVLCSMGDWDGVELGQNSILRYPMLPSTVAQDIEGLFK